MGKRSKEMYMGRVWSGEREGVHDIIIITKIKEIIKKERRHKIPPWSKPMHLLDLLVSSSSRGSI